MFRFTGCFTFVDRRAATRNSGDLQLSNGSFLLHVRPINGKHGKTTKKMNVFCLGGLELPWPSRLSPSAIFFVHGLPFSYCGVSQFWWADSDFVLLTGHYSYGKMKD
jgi:hypothetical protein